MPTIKKQNPYYQKLSKMSNYKRLFIENSYLFITIVTNKRREILISNIEILRKAIKKSQLQYSYELLAIVILPEHFHILINPKDISDYPKIISNIKRNFTQALPLKIKNIFLKELNNSQKNKKESGVWQRRYYEHTIKNEQDLNKHLDYIHYNPIKHKLVTHLSDWEYSSFMKFVRLGYYDKDWCDFNEKLNLE